MTVVLDILLFLLKLFGILLLAVLGLILLIALLILLAPIRYKGRLDKKEAPEEVFRADGLVSWLNPFLRVRIRYEGKKLRYTVRLFGFCLRDSDKPKKERKKKVKTTKKEKKQKESRKRTKTGQNPVPEQTMPEQNAESMYGEEPVLLAEQEFSADVGMGQSPKGELFAESEGVPTQEPAGEEKKKGSIFAKIKAFVEKIKAIPEKIKQKARRFVNTLKLLWYKKEKVVAFFEDELHLLALGTSWTAIKRLLGHVLPGKIKGHAEFGTGDPESTGKALGVLGVVYAAYGKGLTIVPDFYEKRLLAEISFRGRIRCGTVLVICLKLIRDKQVKRMYRNWKKLVAILKQKAE